VNIDQHETRMVTGNGVQILLAFLTMPIRLKVALIYFVVHKPP
jgi:hypothetical protein